MSQNIASAIKDLIGLGSQFGYFDRQTDRDNGLRDVLDELRLSSGIGDEVLVNDCETVADWTENDDGDLDVAIDNTDYKVGSNSIQLTSTTAETGNVSTDYINAGALAIVDPTSQRKQQNWNNSDFIILWATAADASGDFATAGDLKLNLQNYGNPTAGQAAWGAAVNVPAVTYHATAIWRSLAIEITSFQRDKIEQIRFENNEPTGSQDINIDQIVRAKFSDGKGPLRGPCIPLPILSGTAILIGNIVVYDLSTRRATNAAGASALAIGPCVIPGTGNAAGTVMAWMVHEGFARMRTAASSGIAQNDGIIYASVNTIADVDNAAAEVNGFGFALEAPAEDSTGGHDIDVRIFKVSKGLTS